MLVMTYTLQQLLPPSNTRRIGVALVKSKQNDWTMLLHQSAYTDLHFCY